ncbi:ribonucleases P/MRP protein subunit POP1-domain-containing protein [Xylaria sp. CBS 124048]|nr:ribonucleases P/MRP protein subunit POP1-domain-containing protein [Xylaria sp. CBS 124048]
MPPKQASQGKSSRLGNTGDAATGQSNKRKQGPQDHNSQANPRVAKRSKVQESRSIAVQSQHAALQDGELNVQSFVDSMAFQISALDESMRRTRSSGSSRAFQRVPFVMRRRTAAHNYKRVPKRLHKRAKKEMAEDNTPTVNSKTRKPKTSRARLRSETARKLGILARRRLLQKKKRSVYSGGIATPTAARPKIRRNQPNDLPITAPKFRKRQIHKTWLPTHLWHAKRARMTPPSEPLWGFSIPVTPNQKNYRPTHRALWQKGAIAWDMSYMSTIGIFGKENIIKNILIDMGLCQGSLWNERGTRWRNGAVHWTGDLRRKVKTTVHFIGPATVIWNPVKPSETAENASPTRQLIIRIHPSAFLETFDELLRLVKAYTPRPYIQDLRHEIGSIDVTGPDSTEALLGVLKPSESGSKGAHASKFASLSGLKDPASLPLGALLAFSIRDPRLSYPPQTIQTPAATSQQVQTKLLESISAFRKEETSEPYQLLDRDARFKASRLPSQKSLNRRRGKTGPGVAVESNSADPSIPVMLLASRNADQTRPTSIPGTWTLLLPWKCVKAVWDSLMHYPLSTGGNPAFGGIDEIRQLTFERGQPWFPGDIPGTDAGNAWETRQRQVRLKVWNRKPKGKRAQWESLDLGAGRKGEVGEGWSCDYETMFRLQSPTESVTTSVAEDTATEDHEMTEAPEVAVVKKAATPKEPVAKPLSDATYLPKPDLLDLANGSPDSLPPRSLVTVSIKLLGRGTVTACARVYRLPYPAQAQTSSQIEVPATQMTRKSNNNNNTNCHLPRDLHTQWLATKPTSKPKLNKTPQIINTSSTPATPEARKQALAQLLIGPQKPYPPLPPNSDSINGHPLCPDATDLIGFVTTGAFNLRHGRGEALGALSAQSALDELRRHGKHDAAARLCVVREAGQGVGWLARWEII